MCGRYVSPDEAAIERAFHIGRRNSNPFPRRFNVSPSMEVPFLWRDAGVLALATGRWGLIPHWWTRPELPRFTHNARLEEAARKPMWRDAMRRARCLVPAEGWYEWRESDRQPYFIHRRDGRLVCFAGLMSFWKKPGAENEIATCAIVTAAAAGAIAQVHHRMPLALPDDAQEQWLSGGDAVLSQEFAFYPVKKTVNNSRAEGPELVEPLAKA